VPWTTALGWVDIAMIGLIVLSAVLGLLRGITFELFSLAGWFVAYVAARWLEPFVAPQLPIGASGSALNRGAAFASAFLAVLIVWSLLARGASALIGATPLKPLDRLLGALFGLARGTLVLLVVATVIAYTPLRHSPVWRESMGAALLDSALRQLLPLVPGGSALPARTA
jgi:membrane protein required for colicin V production